MTYLTAAIAVLQASGRPLTTSEVMAEITRQGLIPITGQTPEATLSAALYRNLGKHPQLRREAVQAQCHLP
jgi:hypothetical protein